MKHALLVLVCFCSLGAFASEFKTSPQDYRLPGMDEQSTYVQYRKFQGTDFGIMYQQGGIQIGEPHIIGYCLWQNAGAVKSCQDDHDSRLSAFMQSLKGPTLECSNDHFKFTVAIDHGKFMMSAASEAISEAEGIIFIKWFESEALLS